LFARSRKPRKIILLVKAGDPVDWTIKLIKPFLDNGDIIIDGGNSHFTDTERREKALKAEEFSSSVGHVGWREGSAVGPSLMPWWRQECVEQIRPIWKPSPQRSTTSMRDVYRSGASGHFVKMVHTGSNMATCS